MADNTYAEKTAAEWIKPGGGYDQWKKSDPAREAQLPPGTQAPANFMPIGNNTPVESSPKYTPTAGRADKHSSNTLGR